MSGWRNREKEGLPRIIESLQSNMWSTMKRIDKGDNQLFPFRLIKMNLKIKTKIEGNHYSYMIVTAFYH